MYVEVKSKSKLDYFSSGKSVRLNKQPNAIEIVRDETDYGWTWRLKIALSGVVNRGDGSRGGKPVSIGHTFEVEFEREDIEAMFRTLLRENLLTIAAKPGRAPRNKGNEQSGR